MATEEIKEPDNSTVDDWFGQNVARDAEKADEIVGEEGNGPEAEAGVDRDADGHQRFKEGLSCLRLWFCRRCPRPKSCCWTAGVSSSCVRSPGLLVRSRAC